MPIMNIADFPRPPQDTGLGIHLSASNSHPMGEFADGYPGIIKNLTDLGIKWAKLVVGGKNGIPACKALWAAGIMPIIRFYEPAQNPDALCDRQLDLGANVRAYADALGFPPYVEVNNEPNLLGEWKGGWGKSDEDPTPWKEGAQPDRVAQSWVRDALVVLDSGGLPGTPALSPGGHYNDVDFFRTFTLWLKQHGYADLFQRGCWIAIHNGTMNHPLDYPFDDVNQKGTPVSQEEYDAHEWAGSREYVNQQRALGKNPGQHLLSVHPAGHLLAGKDSGGSNCWNKPIAYRDIFKETFGFTIPILGTEGGVWVGTTIDKDNGARIDDPRYPAVSIQQQSDWTVEICRAMMAGEYIDEYFCTGFWLYANQGMGNNYEAFERDAWFGFKWKDGVLPVVEALKALPKRVRPPHVEAPVPVPTGVQLTDTQIASLNQAAGFTGEDLVVSVAIAIAESQGWTNAVGINAWNSSEDLGYMQIQWPLHSALFATKADAFDPVMNAAAAFIIWGYGKSWVPWSTWPPGPNSHLNYMDRARAAVAALNQLPTEEQLRRFAWEQCIGVPEEAALMREARRLGLAPICGEGRGTINCGPYVGQVFVPAERMVLLYCRDGKWDTVYLKRLP